MFTIITPTYKRADLLKRAVNSVQSQVFSDWNMIIVNDSPDDTGYEEIEKRISVDNRIVYIKNTINSGVNSTRNTALDYAEKNFKDTWIIFLDDDDYFTRDCLMTQSLLISRHPEYKWFVTNRKDSTQIYPDYSAHTYVWEWLISKKIKGDATHCILFSSISDSRFSKKVRQGEEWIYFYQISQRLKYKGKNFLYHDVDTTLSDGYTTEGLNFRPRAKQDRRDDLKLLIEEGKELHISSGIGFIFYTLGQKLKLLF